jgi:hypothetical protein
MRKIYQCFSIVLVLCLLLSQHGFAQQVVTGTVKDATGVALPGVNVLIKGTTTGTATDSQGKFSLQASANDVLVVSFIGYKTLEQQVGTQTSFEFGLEEDMIALEEIVVVGYGEAKKKLVTGANIQVAGETLQKQNQLNPLQAMQGQAPGINIISTSGQPGAGLKVVVRGLGTIGNSGPFM